MAGDFELLSTFITVRTRGVQRVLSDLARVRRAAQNIQVNLTPNRTVRGDSPASTQARNEDRARRERIAAFEEEQRELNQHLRSMQLAEAASLRQRAANFARTLRERVNAIRKTNADERRLLADQEKRRRVIAQQINSISLEAGFIAPFTRLAGNILRITNAFREMARAAGFSALAVRGAGIAGAAFAVTLRAMQVLVNLLGAGLRAVASVITGALRIAFSTILGPSLAFLRVIRQLISNMPILAAIVGTLLTRSLVRVTQEFQRLTAAFEFAFGSRAGAEFQQIINLAQRLGIPLTVVADNYARITSAARDAGIAQQDLRNLVEGIGAASAALSLDQERVNGLFFAFEQIISKGKLSAEELRRQIGDRLPGAFTLAARALGVTTERLDQMLEVGAVRSDQFIAAMGRQLLRSFGPQAQKQAQRLTATLARMNNELQLTFLALATRVEPGITRVVERFRRMIVLIRNSAAFRAFGDAIVSVLDTIDRNFLFITDAIRRFLAQVAPVFQRLGRLILIVNTVAIGGMIEAFRRLQPLAATVLERIEQGFSRLVGVDFSPMRANLESILVILNNMPLIFELIELRVKAVGLAVRNWFETQFAGTIFLARLLGDTFDLTLMDATTESGQRLLGIQREIALVTAEIEQRMKGAFDPTLFGPFIRVLRDVQDRVQLALVPDGPIGSNIGRNALQDVGRVVTSAGGIGAAAVSARRNRGEDDLSVIANFIRSIDSKVADMPDAVEALVRAGVLALPGGGLTR